MPISSQQINGASHGDPKTMIALDDAGIFCGSQEDALEFSGRIDALRTNCRRMEDDLRKEGKYSVEDISVDAGQRIPVAFYKIPGDLTWQLYHFRCEWVPGFFTGKEMGGFLFGGCALSFFPDFFALFLLRKSFSNRKKWLCYRRDELLAHELCHIARIGLNSTTFEEIFAYRTASSPFRRFIGGIFHQASDAYWFIAAAILLPIAQFIKIFIWDGLPIGLFWALLGLIVIFFLGRHLRDMRILNLAARNMSEIFAKDDIFPVLFRCNDQEIFEFARMNQEQLRRFIQEKMTSSLRWQTTLAKFPMRA